MRTAFLVLVVCAPWLPSQSLTFTVTNNPVPPGGVVMAAIVNGTTTQLNYDGNGDVLFVLRASGELVAPPYQTLGDNFGSILPGATLNRTIGAPSIPGSYVLLAEVGFPGPAGYHPIVTRLDVGAPTAGFPALHAYAQCVFHGYGGHSCPGVAFANLSNSAHTFAAGDTIEVLAPGAVVPTTTMSLAGIAVPPGRWMTFPLPSVATTGPHTIQLSWLDPVAGPIIRRLGLRDEAHASLHYPDGRQLAPGAPIRARVVVTPPFPGPPFMFVDPQYIFLLGLQPGVTAIPGGLLAPLDVNDPLVQASLFGSLGAYLINASGSMTAFAPCNGICAALYFISPDITLNHPNLVGLSGVVLRSAVVFHDNATGFWGTSQPEELTLQ